MAALEEQRRIEELNKVRALIAEELRRLEPTFVSVEEANELARDYFEEYLHDIHIDILLNGWMERSKFEHTEGYYLLILAQEVPSFLFNPRNKSELFGIEYASDINDRLRDKIEYFFRSLTEDKLKEIVQKVKKKLTV